VVARLKQHSNLELSNEKGEQPLLAEEENRENGPLSRALSKKPRNRLKDNVGMPGKKDFSSQGKRGKETDLGAFKRGG